MANSPRLPDNGFATNEGGAAFGNPRAVRAAQKAGATQVAPTSNANTAPAKAPAAPKGNTKEVFTGLAEALNSHQQKLVKENKYQIADIYEFEFGEGIGAATLKKQGGTDYSAVAMQDKKTAKLALDAKTNSMNTNSRGIQVSAGMQIVQFIDETIRNSSYITNQQLYIYDKNNKLIPNPAVSGKPVAWFKINVQSTFIGYDERRSDNAYKMKFLITPYAINAAPSEYFSKSRYRGSHKKYYYWFTGQNTQILHFEQDINYAFRLAVTGTGKLGGNSIPKNDFRGGDQIRRTYMATSENHAKGADGYVNEPGDNLAEILYNPSDFKGIKLKIVGDPAWLQQGEISSGVSAPNFNYGPFNDDGTINYDSQEVVFDVSWNRPADYNFNTGLMDVTAKNTKNNEAQENNTYKATIVKSTFSKGRFEQEITGQALIGYETTAQNAATSEAATNGRPAANSAEAIGNTVYGDNRGSSTTSPETGDWAAEVARTQQDNVETATQQNENDSAPQPQPSPPPGETTSSGDVTAADIAAIEANRNIPAAPQNASAAAAAVAANPTLVVYGGSLTTPGQGRLVEGEVRVYGENSTPQTIAREA